MTAKILFILAVASLQAIAGIQDLIALPDGKTVYFHMKTGLVADTWFQLQETSPGVSSITKGPDNLIDLDGTAGLAAVAFFGNRSCGLSGSSCFLQPSCRANGSIVSQWFTLGVSLSQETFLRFNRMGTAVWIETGQTCPSTDPVSPPRLGLYDAKTLQPVSPSTYHLANHRIGRRLVTNQNKALVRYDADHLGWWTAGGILERLNNRDAAEEAVTDESGCAVVYSSAATHALNWIDTGCAGSGAAGEEALQGANGSSLVMSDNGRYLAYIDDESRTLRVYDRWRRILASDLIADPVQSLTAGGTALFVATARNELVRLDLDSGESHSVLPQLPQFDQVLAPQSYEFTCPFVCYGPVEPRPLVSPGMALYFEGMNLDRPGWTVQLGERKAPLQAVSSTSAWFEFAKDAGTETTMATVSHPDLSPIEFHLLLMPNRNAFACLAMMHRDGGGPVTAADPLRLGEVLRLRVTGLGDGNPPPLIDPFAEELVIIQASPNEVGIQYLDLKILQPITPAAGTGLFATSLGYGCTVPPIQGN